MGIISEQYVLHSVFSYCVRWILLWLDCSLLSCIAGWHAEHATVSSLAWLYHAG